ncbi:Orotidine-5'-monophosphate decarboxylase and orotate phosphoribosyltransferase, related [Eimeria tenella]|uniref:Orotidine 5'-phosphate decarboxylase n=1 Tax=Eimeria tenella TaxID=5802 RepID=U6KUT7_EIMTE|nr:Orotidine-5'-monophosphate decarboxylase and orotate phosphoribosyltransferase, related [Eimeria tenella]CDJ40683.1 Orotidine-5'-monophosphate decarboxylase and orotate phosphoribosyltransferase, related [Eimeria tenella]|eukprot:XP_013231433.1 Orotidine-5'-monophosphate decarboxylase and orotate phosphoribosyltransferase, related [Eimeria tenella]
MQGISSLLPLPSGAEPGLCLALSPPLWGRPCVVAREGHLGGPSGGPPEARGAPGGPRVPCKACGEPPCICEVQQQLLQALAAAAATGKLHALLLEMPFYEQFGPKGFKLLENIAQAAHPLPLVLDAKRGDISNTAKAYAQALFGVLGAAAATVSCYMGRDSIIPFLSFNKNVFVFVECLPAAAAAAAGLAALKGFKPPAAAAAVPAAAATAPVAAAAETGQGAAAAAAKTEAAAAAAAAAAAPEEAAAADPTAAAAAAAAAATPVAMYEHVAELCSELSAAEVFQRVLISVKPARLSQQQQQQLPDDVLLQHEDLLLLPPPAASAKSAAPQIRGFPLRVP